MRILIAPDKFKGSLEAEAVASIIAGVLEERYPDAVVECCPIADGGEGTARVLCAAMDGRWVTVPVKNALGVSVDAGFSLAISEGEMVGLVDMSAACGLAMLPEEARDPWRASTEGVGMLLKAAANAGAGRMVLGIGGSATNDGGAGMAKALGFVFLSASGEIIEAIPERLMEVVDVFDSLERDLPEIVVACDVTNPLLGPEGATRVYGPQKGIAAEDSARHDERLGHLVDLLGAGEIATRPGAGAAGGLGFGLMRFLGAELEPGFELVAEVTGLRGRIEAADIVITGEGSIDAQTLMGKGPAGVARMAKAAGKKVVAFCGVASVESPLFDEILPICPPGMERRDAMAAATELLAKAVKAWRI
jgi:glycerate kinase